MENKKLLENFTHYCEKYPEQRFWQALRNWAEVAYIGAKNEDKYLDTFYWLEKNEL